MKKPYYGWWVVTASLVGLTVSPGPVAFYSIGVLMQPLADTYGWDRAQLSLIATILTFAIFVTVPFVGAAIDRYGPKRVLVLSLIGYGLSLFAAGFATTLWSLYLVYALVGVTCAGANSVSYLQAISVWFDRHRGLATALACMGMGVGFTFVPLYTQFLVDRGGLFAAFTGLAAAILGIGLPVILLFFRDAPRPEQVRPEEFTATVAKGEAGELQGATARVAVRMPQFWAILVIFTVVAASAYGIALHLVSIVRGIDAAHDQSILAATLFGLMAVFGRLIAGLLYDRIFVPYVTAGIFLCGAVGTLLLAFGFTGAWPLLAAVLLGFCSATESDALAILCSRYFGVRAYGKVYSYAFAATLAGISIGPYVLGLAYEHFHGYHEILYGTAAVLAVGAVLTLFLGPFPQYGPDGQPIRRGAAVSPVQVSDRA